MEWQRISSAERTAYGHRLNEMSLAELRAEVAKLNREIVAADTALLALAQGPEDAVDPTADADMTDPEIVAELARGYARQPTENEALGRARVHRRNLETRVEMAGPMLSARLQEVAWRNARADLAKRASKIQTAIAELHAHIITTRAAGTRAVVDLETVRQLERALEIATK